MEFFAHDVGVQEADAVKQAILDGNLTTGVVLKQFAEALEDKFGFHRVVLCSSGTSALQLTLHALGVGPGDEVITTPYVGVWTANTILMNGATPVFADIDPQTYNLDPDSVASRLTGKTKVVLPVSVNGVPVDYQRMRSRVPPNIRIVCDDIEALGSSRYDRYVGADVGNDISVNGFWVSKQVTTCGGGMVTSEDDKFLDTFAGLTRHGHGLVGDKWNQKFGFNAWLADPMAAMGVVQLKRFWVKQGRLMDVKKKLDVHFASACIQACQPGHRKTEFIYMIELPPGADKRRYSDAMSDLGVPTNPYFNSLLTVPHLKQYASPCPYATAVASRTVALPYHWKLSDEDVARIAEAHQEAVYAAS